MGKVLRLAPKLHFPVGRPFQVKDQYNGHQRGTWFYREPFHGALRGPYHCFEEAALFLSREEEDGA